MGLGCRMDYKDIGFIAVTEEDQYYLKDKIVNLRIVSETFIQICRRRRNFCPSYGVKTCGLAVGRTVKM